MGPNYNEVISQTGRPKADLVKLAIVHTCIHVLLVYDDQTEQSALFCRVFCVIAWPRPVLNLTPNRLHCVGRAHCRCQLTEKV